MESDFESGTDGERESVNIEGNYAEDTKEGEIYHDKDGKVIRHPNLVEGFNGPNDPWRDVVEAHDDG